MIYGNDIACIPAKIVYLKAAQYNNQLKRADPFAVTDNLRMLQETTSSSTNAT